MSNPKNLEYTDGWYLNANKNSDGSPVELYNGWGTMAAGDCVFYTAGERAKSGDAFGVALSAGLLKGPFACQAEAVSSTVKVEAKKADHVSEPVPEIEMRLDEVLEVDEDETEKPAPKVEVKKSSHAKK